MFPKPEFTGRVHITIIEWTQTIELIFLLKEKEMHVFSFRIGSKHYIAIADKSPRNIEYSLMHMLSVWTFLGHQHKQRKSQCNNSEPNKQRWAQLTVRRRAWSSVWNQTNALHMKLDVEHFSWSTLPRYEAVNLFLDPPKAQHLYWFYLR